MSEPAARHVLSDDGMTLTIKRPAPNGVMTITLHRQPGAGPFTDEDVAFALGAAPTGRNWPPGQRNRTRRMVTRFGTLWTDLMLGPPTWWLPKVRQEDDGTVMAGWFRAAVAVRYDRPGEQAAKESGR